MTWPKYVLIALYILSILGTIAGIGKPRKPTTPEFAIGALIMSAIMVSLVLLA